MLYYGEGIDVNKREALNYFKISADAGNVDAMNYCGYILRNGDGVTLSKIDAFKYYKMAAEK